MEWLEQSGQEPRALLQAVIEAIPEPFFVFDRDGRYVALLGGVDNPRYHDGRPLIGRRIHDVMEPHLADLFVERLREALDTGQVVRLQYELSSDDVSGVEARPGVADRLWFDSHISPLPRVEGRPDLAVWMMFNITELKRALERLESQQSELEQRARTDALTGLLNRSSYFEEAGRELEWIRRTGSVSSIVLFDLDRFKTINDSSGHAAGDEVLRRVGALFTSRRRTTDLVARIGGEEFAMVVRGADLDRAAQLAERLRDELASTTVEFEGSTIAVTASFGVSEMVPTDSDPDDAVKRADRAMYRAKSAGRDRVEVQPAG